MQNCADFNEALWIKSWLTYRLGRVLLECDKAKFKGAYLSFFRKIKQAKKDFKALKESVVYEKKEEFKFKDEESFDFFLTHYRGFEGLLGAYEALNEALVLNASFVLKHLDAVNVWINSKEFKEKYEGQSHPYPPLLDPEILNALLDFELDEFESLKDERLISYAKEGLDYRLINAQEAWDMNLPLPRRYEFVVAYIPGAATQLLENIFTKVFEKNFTSICWDRDDKYYFNAYNMLKKYRDNNVIAFHLEWINEKIMRKIAFLIDFKVDIFVPLRDPIALLLSWVNHRGHIYQTRHHITLKTNLKWAFDDYSFNGTQYVNNEPIRVDMKRPIPDTAQLYFSVLTLYSRLQYFDMLKFKISYFDVDLLIPQHIEENIRFLENKFNFKANKKELLKLTQRRKNGVKTVVWDLPRTLHCYTNDKEKEQNIEIFIHTSDFCDQFVNLNEKKDLSSQFLIKNTYQLSFLIDKNKYDLLISNTALYEKVKKYCNYFEKALERRVNYKNTIIVKAEELIEFLRKNDGVRIKLFDLLKLEFSHIKTARPDIVASWKYYNEFEKICEGFED